MSYLLVNSDNRRGIPLADESCHMIVCSPPYWGLRSYLPDGHGLKSREMGLEVTPGEFVAGMVAVFREVRRVLRSDGTAWVNMGDSYATGAASPHREMRDSKAMQGNGGWTNREQGKASTLAPGLKPKDLVGVPWRLALALQADGWWLRSEIIWAKPNPMPESVTDRPTKSHEQVFLLSKSSTYYYDAEGVREGVAKSTPSRDKYAKSHPKGWHTSAVPIDGGDSHDGIIRASSGANLRSVWNIPTESFPGSHFATYPRELVSRCIRAGSRPGDIVLDPFVGSGTSIVVANALGRRGIGLDLSPDYLRMARQRIERPHRRPDRPAREEHFPLFAEAP